MKKIYIPALLMAAIFISMAMHPSRPQDDPEKLKTVLTNFFDGIATKDTEKLRNATTSDFILYEDGLLWNLDSAFMNIKRHMPFTVKYRMNNLKFFVDTESGDVTYTNHADFHFTGGDVSLDWLENATFRKIDGVWKINFLNATIKK